MDGANRETVSAGSLAAVVEGDGRDGWVGRHYGVRKRKGLGGRWRGGGPRVGQRGERVTKELNARPFNLFLTPTSYYDCTQIPDVRCGKS